MLPGGCTVIQQSRTGPDGGWRQAPALRPPQLLPCRGL